MTENEVVAITTPLLFTWIGCIVLLERKFPFRPGLKIIREGFWIDFVWYTVIQSYFLKILIFDFIIQPIDVKFQISRLHLITDWPVWAQVLLFLFTHDLYIYLFHRWQHNNKWLWRTHEAHHSGKEVDWLSGSRSHVVEIIINQSIEFAPILLLGADPIVVPIKAFLDAVWGIWIHANIDCRLGWLGKIINTPVMHQWHHADHQEVFYSNYSTKFSFWDYLFGTAYVPDHKPQKWGIPYEYPRDYFMQHAFSVRRFDETRWLKYAWFRGYYNLRLRIMNMFPKIFGHHELYTYKDESNNVKVYSTNFTREEEPVVP